MPGDRHSCWRIPETAPFPTVAAFHGTFCVGFIGVEGGTFVEGEDEVCAKRPLDFDGFFRGEVARAAVDVRPKIRPIFVDVEQRFRNMSIAPAFNLVIHSPVP
jgi:hypothetical protein